MEEEKITPAKLIYDFFMDEGARLHQRTDWFLIFHGILLEAFFAAPQGAARFIVGILGFDIISVVYDGVSASLDPPAFRCLYG